MQSCQIGISVYRQPLEWLIRAVESAQSQVARNTIWIRIDGPTACDVQCRSWLKRAAATNPSIILIEGRERLGTFASYREIFSCDGSDFLCQLDADDWLESNAISSCMEALAENPDAPFAYTNYREVTDDGRHIRPGKRSLEQFDHSKMLVQFITFHLRVIRRKAYIMTGGYDPSLLYAGDYDLSLKLCEQGTPVHVNRIVYNYRIHDRNTSFNKRQQTILEAFSVAQGALERRRLNHLFRLELEAGASRVHLRHRLGPIVIAGMHRSGTSVLALMLQHLGMDFGSKLLAADQFNPDGYLEDETIIALHRGWLQQNHQGSEGWPDWGWKVDAANFEVPAPTAAWMLKAREYLNHRNQSTIPWGWKDPRSTLFLEQWLSLDPGLRVIGIYRHPWEIIDALQRVRPPVFLKHPNWGLAIWCQYNKALLGFAKKRPERCILISSESLRKSPQELQEILEKRWQWSSISKSHCDSNLLQELIRQDRLKSHEAHDPLIPLHAHCSAEAWKLLDQLNQHADLPSPLTASDPKSKQSSLKLCTINPKVKEPPELAVIITSYNQGDLLLEAVASVERSIRHQDNIELLIVDDGSTDARTLCVLDGLNQLGYRILRQTNQGLSSARNTGIQATKASVLLFLDDDNRLLAPYLKEGMEMMRRHASVDVIYGDRIDFGLITRIHRVGLVTQQALWQMNRIDNCALIRRSLLNRCGGYDVELPAFEDWDLWLNAMKLKPGLKLAYLNQPCFEYRVRPHSMLQRLLEDNGLQKQVMQRLRRRHGERVGHGGLQPPA